MVAAAYPRIDAGGRLPFWFDDSVAPQTVLYAACSRCLRRGLAGVVPALKVTGAGWTRAFGRRRGRRRPAVRRRVDGGDRLPRWR